jgi:HSP20 family protein
MSLIKYYPAQNHIGTVADAFDTFFGKAGWPARGFRPQVNVQETEGAFLVEVAAPGLRKEEFQVSLERGVLRIAYEHQVEEIQEEGQYRLREFGKQSFSRAFRLPEGIDEDAVQASYEQGVLRIALPKAVAAPKSKQIAVA